MIRNTLWLLLFLASCSTPTEHRTFAGFEDHGDKPGIALELRFVGDRVESGTLSIVAPEGTTEPGEPNRLDCPIQVLSQDGEHLAFRAELGVGNRARPSSFDALMSHQPDGTIHFYFDANDARAGLEHGSPPMIMKRIGE